MEIYAPRPVDATGFDISERSVIEVRFHPVTHPLYHYNPYNHEHRVFEPSERIGTASSTIRESPFSIVFLIKDGEQEIVGKLLKRTPHQIHNQILVQSGLLLQLGQHPNIETYLGIGIIDNPLQPVLLTEYVKDNQTVDDYMNTTQNPKDIVPIIQQLLAAVSHAHNRRIVHGDITLENILIQSINSRPFLKLIDFSIGAYIPPYLQRIRSRTPIGTKYATPIEHTRSCLYGFADDIYGIGYILYQLLHEPYYQSVENDSDEQSTIEAFIFKSIDFTLKKQYQDIFNESDLKEVLRWALHQEYDQRIQTVSELATKLDQCLKQPSFSFTEAL